MKNVLLLMFGCLVALVVVFAVNRGSNSPSVRAAEGETPNQPPPAPTPQPVVSPTPTPVAQDTKTMPAFRKPTDEEIKKALTPIQYQVTQRSGTEPSFHNEYWDNHEAGLYVDIVTGEPLFSSKDKFDSGTGWPSFTRPVATEAVVDKTDVTYGMKRVEVRSNVGDSHLGHVFDDGPAPTGKRYCINSASLKFIPVAKLEEAGYGKFLAQFQGAAALPGVATLPGKAAPNTCTVPLPGQKAGCEATMEIAYLAGGCYWGMQDILRKIPGVIETQVGFTGGKTEHPTYETVHTGLTGHAESVKIVFDNTKISYADLLEKWFFKMHDPTTVNRQGNDRGSQYRSAIFFTSDAQKKTAEEVIAKVNASGKWKAPIATQVVAATPFTPAEEDHQDYLVKHPGGYTCHYMRD